MWILFLEDADGLHLLAIREKLQDLAILIGSEESKWHSVNSLTAEYLPMDDSPQCYVAYYMDPAMGLEEVQVAFSEEILNA